MSAQNAQIALARTIHGASITAADIAAQGICPEPSARRALRALAQMTPVAAQTNETLGCSVHPFADKFPLLGEDLLKALAEDIQAHGQREPILVDAQGTIIDGRNRYAACLLAEVTPLAELYVPEAKDAEAVEVEVQNLIASLNVHRRHLDAEQRGIYLDMLIELHGVRGPGRPKKGDTRPTQSQLAEMAGVSTPTVGRAAAKREEEGKSNAGLAEQVAGDPAKVKKAREAAERAEARRAERAKAKAETAWRAELRGELTGAVGRMLTELIAAKSDTPADPTEMTESDFNSWKRQLKARIDEVVDAFAKPYLDEPTEWEAANPE